MAVFKRRRRPVKTDCQGRHGRRGAGLVQRHRTDTPHKVYITTAFGRTFAGIDAAADDGREFDSSAHWFNIVGTNLNYANSTKSSTATADQAVNEAVLHDLVVVKAFRCSQKVTADNGQADVAQRSAEQAEAGEAILLENRVGDAVRAGKVAGIGPGTASSLGGRPRHCTMSCYQGRIYRRADSNHLPSPATGCFPASRLDMRAEQSPKSQTQRRGQTYAPNILALCRWRSLRSASLTRVFPQHFVSGPRERGWPRHPREMSSGTCAGSSPATRSAMFTADSKAPDGHNSTYRSR